MTTDRLSLQRRRSALKSLRRKDTIGIILLGDEKVGKTALIDRFLNDTYTDKYTPTVETFHDKERIVGKRSVNIGLVDIAGSGQFPAMDELYIKKSDSIIFVYEIGDEKSIKSIERYYRNVKRIIGEKSVLMSVAGTKHDKFDETGYFDEYDIGKEYFNELKTPPVQFLTSAKNNQGVSDLFHHAIGTVVSQLFPGDERLKELLKAGIRESEKNERGHCCNIL